MIKSLDELRKLAVKHILRKGPADYLLRHSLCRPWVASTHLDEMAWTDFKSLFFNFPKLNARLDQAAIDAPQAVTSSGAVSNNAGLDPGDYTAAFLAAACHEVLHVLWLHRYRGKDKQFHEWRAACEYAINLELAEIFGKAWIDHLGVMYPPVDLLAELRQAGLAPTTDGFYQTLLDRAERGTPVPVMVVHCRFCERAKEIEEQEEPMDPRDMVRVLHQLPPDSAEREDIIRFLTSQQAPPQAVPWEMLLLGGIENAMSQEQSWAVPSRRNEMMPGWRHEKLLSFVWILDVSPSIDDEMKQSFMSTVQAGINLYHDAQHRVICFADHVEADFVVSSGTDLGTVEIPSGNGTDLTDVWAILEQDMPEYALVLTDLELSAVPKPSFTKVVWGIVGNYQCFDPDYGVKVFLK